MVEALILIGMDYDESGKVEYSQFTIDGSLMGTSIFPVLIGGQSSVFENKLKRDSFNEVINGLMGSWEATSYRLLNGYMINEDGKMVEREEFDSREVDRIKQNIRVYGGHLAIS